MPQRSLARFSTIVAVGLILLPSCDLHGPSPPDVAFTFSHQGLDGLTVRHFRSVTGALLAATSDGMFIQNPDATGWQRLGLEGFDIMDVAVFSDAHFLASTYTIDEDGYPHYVRFRTLNGGQDWQLSPDNFGHEETADYLFGLHFDVVSQRLWGTGTQVLAWSDDLGHTWQVEWGFFGAVAAGFPLVHLNRETNEVWFGGQGPIENGILIQYDLTAGTFTQHGGIFPNPTTFHSAHFVEGQPDLVYVSGEGGVALSEDRGQSWTNLLGDVDYRFYFDVAFDPEDPSWLYTAGWTKTGGLPQPLILEWSMDRGQSWQRYEYPAPAGFFGGVRSMIMVTEGAEKVWYLGLDKGGIMRVTVEG